MNNVRSALCILLVVGSSFAQKNPGIRSGPMVGYGEMTETMIWVQTTRPATVQYRYWIEGKKSDPRLSRKVTTSEDSDLIAKIVLPHLTPGVRYEYELLLNGKVYPRPYPLTFITQTFWQWRTEPPAFSVAFGSCMFINDPPSDRPGDPYGASYNIFSSIAAKKPDLMLWLGDNWYYREPDYFSEAGMRWRVARDRSVAELQPLLGSTHHYAIWDDHDFGDNDGDRTYRLRTESLRVFKDYCPNQVFGTLETPGVFHRILWGDVDFFMLDCRFHRSPNHMIAHAEKQMLGKEQLAWLKECLVQSQASFKIIVNGNQMIVPNNVETFRNYRKEYDELMAWLQSEKIGGVLFLSGDRHLAQLSVLRDSTFYPLYEFTSSPLTGGLSSNRKAEDNPLGVPGTFVNDARNFGMLHFDGPRVDRRLTMEAYDSEGRLRWSHVIRANELKPPELR